MPLQQQAALRTHVWMSWIDSQAGNAQLRWYCAGAAQVSCCPAHDEHLLPLQQRCLETSFQQPAFAILRSCGVGSEG